MTPLDPTSRAASFTVQAALESGLSVAKLRHPRYERPFHGIRRLAEPPAATVTLREIVEAKALDFLPMMRAGEAYSHESALLLLGCPIRCPPKLHVTSPPPMSPHSGAGVVGHTATGFPNASSTPSGLPIVSPQRALLQASAALPLRELVVAVDHLIRAWGPSGSRALVSWEALHTAAVASRQRGVRRARTALLFARVGAESRMETLLRLIMACYGLDILELQVELFDGDGRWIGRFDMVDRKRKLVIEYDGEQHRTDRDQYFKDQNRLDRARAAGYQILRLHAEDLLHRPRETARRIAEFLGMPLRPVAPELMRELLG